MGYNAAVCNFLVEAGSASGWGKQLSSKSLSQPKEPCKNYPIIINWYPCSKKSAPSRTPVARLIHQVPRQERTPAPLPAGMLQTRQLRRLWPWQCQPLPRPSNAKKTSFGSYEICEICILYVLFLTWMHWAALIHRKIILKRRLCTYNNCGNHVSLEPDAGWNLYIII